MNKNEAKAILISQKRKLNNSFQLGDFIWLHATRHYIEHIFTKDSEAYSLLSDVRPTYQEDASYAEIVSTLNKMFDEWTEMIDRGAYHHPPRQNFFRHIPDPHLIWLLPLVITVLVTAGYGFGVFTTDYKIDRIGEENKNLKDSISSLHLRIIKLENQISNYPGINKSKFTDSLVNH